MKVEELVKELRRPLTANRSIELRAKAADWLEALAEVKDAYKHLYDDILDPARYDRAAKALARLAELEGQ